VVVAFLAIPLTFGWWVLSVGLFGGFNVVGLLGTVTLAFVPAGLWMGVLVAKHVWTRLVLVLCTALLFIVAIVAVTDFMNVAEHDAWGASCLYVETADGGEVQPDTERCESVEDGTYRRTNCIRFALGSGVFWIGPLVVLHALRRRFQPDDRQETSPMLVQVSGWLRVSLGSISFILALTIQEATLTRSDTGLSVVTDSRPYAVPAAMLLVIPVLAGVLLIRRGRRPRSRRGSEQTRTGVDGTSECGQADTFEHRNQPKRIGVGATGGRKC
jgi:hypothetical protein